MPLVPANCLSRAELHRLIDRCEILAGSECNELTPHLANLMRAAAGLDGVLAELAPEANAHPSHREVFSDDWPSHWAESTFSIHCDTSPITATYCRQMLRRPCDGMLFDTGRRKLLLGEKTYHGTPQELRRLAGSHFSGDSHPSEEAINFAWPED